jgi:hypothetical protein
MRRSPVAGPPALGNAARAGSAEMELTKPSVSLSPIGPAGYITSKRRIRDRSGQRRRGGPTGPTLRRVMVPLCVQPVEALRVELDLLEDPDVFEPGLRGQAPERLGSHHGTHRCRGLI